MTSLPKKLLFIPSSDKNFIEKWRKTRDPLDFPASYRICLMGKPGCGKTSLIKNIFLRTQQSKKPFERVFVFHQDRYAREYDDIGAKVLEELPPNDYWMNYEDEDEEEDEDKEIVRPKTLVIIDDICFRDLSREQTSRLDRLCGFISTHCNVSLGCLNQDVFAINNIVRKCASILCIWRPTDLDELNVIARRTGYKSKDFKQLFNEVAKGENDFIMIDMTPKSPFPLRLNGYKMIKKK